MKIRSALLAVIGILIIFLNGCSRIASKPQEASLTIATWNLRGYSTGIVKEDKILLK